MSNVHKPSKNSNNSIHRHNCNISDPLSHLSSQPAPESRFTHELAQSLPEHFVAITAACGGKPQRGYERNLKPEGSLVCIWLWE